MSASINVIRHKAWCFNRNLKVRKVRQFSIQNLKNGSILSVLFLQQNFLRVNTDFPGKWLTNEMGSYVLYLNESSQTLYSLIILIIAYLIRLKGTRKEHLKRKCC